MWFDHLVHDLRGAARNIRRYPVAALVAISSLAGGIGATTVTLAVRDAVFRKPPPLYMDTFSQLLDVMGQEILVGTAPLFPLIAIGMFLTASGIYGVLAFAVTRRSRELAIRMAVGATGADVTRLVGAHGLRLVALGTLLGGGLTFALARVVRANGGGGSIFDPRPPAFILPVVLVLTVAMLAMWVPSRRARLIDPAVLLKSQ
jgi:ABC-type antimicrobial peptide transport system permease subunit